VVSEAQGREADDFAALLDGEVSAASAMPRRLLELAVFATEVADALGAPALSRADRDRIHARVAVLMGRRSGVFGALRSRPAVLAGAGGAAVGLTVLGLALLRRSHSGGTAASPA
jgi:hypothetical protein